MNSLFLDVDGCRCLRIGHESGRHLLRLDPKTDHTGIDGQPTPKDRTAAATADAIICKQCLHEITSSVERIVIDGAHTHTFANPEGIVFEIACYGNAHGCGYIGPSSPEFTWFVGYVWRIAVCANCHTHLGWRFAALDGHVFHGLITSHIIAKTMG
jgi:hypothetical protein